MESIVRVAVENDFLNLNQPELAALKESGEQMIGDAGGALYARSLSRVGPTLVAMARIPAAAGSEPQEAVRCFVNAEHLRVYQTGGGRKMPDLDQLIRPFRDQLPNRCRLLILPPEAEAAK